MISRFRKSSILKRDKIGMAERPSEGGYELVREAGPFESMSHLFHDLGIQSNILVSARYSHAKSQRLTPTKVFKALEAVINEHPALSTIGVPQPSRKKAGQHRLWEARLRVLRFEDCVECFQDPIENDHDLVRLFEKCHNSWFDTKDTSKPWWKVVVAGNLVVFVCHHSIGDGISGYAFHRGFLAALNKQRGDVGMDEEVLQDAKFISDLGVPLPGYPMEQIEEKLSWLHVIYHFILWHFIRWFVDQRYFFFSDAKFSRSHPTISKPQTEAERTVTKVQILRFKKEDMEKISGACRQHDVSFTALFHTLVQITLAADIYPHAKIGFSRIAVNIRPLLKINPGPDIFTNAASQYARKQFLGKYRAAGRNPTSLSQPTSPSPFLDIELAWKLAFELKSHMNNFIQTRAVLQDFLTGKILAGDLEDSGSFYGLGLYQNNGYLISNIGTFEPKDDMEGNEWSVGDVGFSAAQIRAALGDAGIVFTVAGLRGGDCVVVAGYEEGVLGGDLVRRVLEWIGGRLGGLV